MPQLEVHDIHTSYGLSQVLFGISFDVGEGDRAPAGTAEGTVEQDARPAASAAGGGDAEPAAAKVITLDTFRKK